MTYLPGGRINATISGNTSGAGALVSSGTLTLAGGNNVTLSQAGNAITISGADQSVQTQNLQNVTLGGNTAGAMAAISSGTMTLIGGNNITLSQAGNAVSIIGGAGGGGGGIALANSQTTYSTGTANLVASGALTIGSTTGQSFNFSVPQTSSLSATGIVSISTNGSTISIGAVAPGATVSRYVYPSEFMPLNTIGATNNTVSFNYVSLDQDVAASQFRAIFSVAANTHTSASTNTYGLTAEVGVYTRNASTISKMSSGSQTWSGTYSTNSTASVGGVRELTVPISLAMSPGEYWFGFRISSSSVNASVGYSQYVVSNQGTLHLSPGRLGAATNTSQLLYPWHGLYATTTGTLPNSVTINDVAGTGTRGSAAMYWFDLRNYTVL
jgi:hypothetical protein